MITDYFLPVFFILLFLFISEVVNLRAGFVIGILAVIIQLGLKNYQFAVLQLLFSCYYFLVKLIKTRKLAHETETEKRFQSLVDYSFQPLILKDGKGQILFASESIRDVLNINEKLLLGKNIEEFLHPDDIPTNRDFLLDIQKNPLTKKTIDFRMKKADSGWIWVRCSSVNLLSHSKVKGIVSNLQDITLQKDLDREKSEIIAEEKKARSLAEKAIRDRDVFLSIASHELKTPLTTVLLQLQVTLRKILTQSLADFSGRELLNSLQIAEKKSQSLSVLIKDLLNVSLASTGRLTLNKEKVNLSDLVQSLPRNYEEEIKLSGCQVIIKVTDDTIPGFWDLARIEQAITNLFSNALKFAAGKKVTITAKKQDQWGIFQIDDEGQGIDPEMLKYVFEPFKRASNHPEIKGLGIGLFIARQIAFAHGGDITVKSTPGKGSTFTLKLPLSPSSLP